MRNRNYLIQKGVLIRYNGMLGIVDVPKKVKHITSDAFSGSEVPGKKKKRSSGARCEKSLETNKRHFA